MSIESRFSYVDSFIKELGNPKDWRYTGIVNDLGNPVGNCICGHPIRYEFIITDGKKEKAIGSTCINYFSSIDTELYASLKDAYEAWLEKKKADLKAIKEAQEAEEVAKIKGEFDSLYEDWSKVVDTAIGARVRIPYDIYFLNRDMGKAPQYKRASTIIKKYEEKIKLIKEVMKSEDFLSIPKFERVIEKVKFLKSEDVDTFMVNVANALKANGFKAKVWSNYGLNRIYLNEGYIEYDFITGNPKLFNVPEICKEIFENVKEGLSSLFQVRETAIYKPL